MKAPLKTLALLGALLVPLPALAQSAPTAAVSHIKANCTFWDGTKNLFLEDKSCELEPSKVGDNFAYIVHFKTGLNVTVEYAGSQGNFHILNIAGKPGMGYDIDREHTDAMTSDLSQEIEWDYNPYYPN